MALPRAVILRARAGEHPSSRGRSLSRLRWRSGSRCTRCSRCTKDPAGLISQFIPWHAISASIPPHAAPEGKRLLEASYRLFGGATVRKQREIATTKRVWNALTWGSLYPETPCLEDVRDPERDAFGATLLELGRRTRILKVKPEDTACVYVEGTVMPRDEAPRLDGTGLEDGQKHPRFASLRYVTTPEAVPEEVRAREACAPFNWSNTSPRRFMMPWRRHCRAWSRCSPMSPPSTTSWCAAPNTDPRSGETCRPMPFAR